MSPNQPGIDAEKIQMIKAFLEESFHDVRTAAFKERFVYNDGQHTSELEVQREFVDDLSSEKLKTYLQRTLLPILRANPGKIIKFGTNGVSVRTREIS